MADTYELLTGIEGLSISKSNISKEYRISDWCRGAIGVYSEININNGGTGISIASTTVAGHEAKLALEFIYPIENNKIVRDSNSAQLFKADYLIRNDDLIGTYSDLLAKLTKLYGEPITCEKTAGYKRYYDVDIKGDSFWKAEDGSIVWLALYYNTSKDTYDAIYLVYAAPNSTDRLIELQNQIEYEKNIPVDENPQQADDNFDGL